MANADYERVLRQYAEAGHQLIVGESFAVEAAARKAAKSYPKISFLMGSSGKPQAPNFSVFDNYIQEPDHAQRLGLQGRVTGSHLTSMHSMDNYYVSKLLPLIKEAGVSVVANPLINITIQGRHDTYPKRSGMTRVPEMLAAGIAVAFGHDCVMDPWYSLGSGDMLEVAHMGLHVAQMTRQEAMAACFAAVTETPARILGLDGYGIAPGCHADLVVLDARNPIEAIRLRAQRLLVMRRGQVIARSAPAHSRLTIAGRPPAVDFRLSA